MTKKVFIIRLPCKVNISKNKAKSLNLNIYRNLHFYSLAYQKKAFYDLIKYRLIDIPRMDKISLSYKIFSTKNTLLDIMNIGSIVDKYFSDCLVQSNIIKDDNYNYLSNVSFSYGGKSKKAYIEVTIKEIIEKEKSKMKISLKAELTIDNIAEAIALWMSQESSYEVKPDDVTFTETGAIVNISNGNGTNSDTIKTPIKRKRRTKAEIEADKAKEDSVNDTSDDNTSSPSRDNSGSIESTEASDEESEDQSSDEEEDQSSTESEENTTETEKVTKTSIFDDA